MKKFPGLSLVFVLVFIFYSSPLIFSETKEAERKHPARPKPGDQSEKISLFELTGDDFGNIFRQTKTSDFSPAIYIPADKRHQGLSRFDQIPFTDRKKGDPDRYRAVNPNYVKKVDGNYYFALTVKADTQYFDENLSDRGILTATNVEVDLTQTKTAKTSGNKTEKYVYVKDKGYIPAAALTQTSDEIKDGRWFRFSIKSGEQWFYDGTGIARGKLAADAVKLNYGQIKEINREIYYYAFSTKIILNRGKEAIGASGWIKASSIQTGNAPQYDIRFVEKMQMPTGAGDTFTKYEITGGDSRETIGRDENGKVKYKFGYASANGEFVVYKVLPKVPLDGKQSIASTDYLKRSDDVINLGFNVAGVSNDTFRIKGANRPLVFYRSADKDATAAIDLFYPKDNVRTGEEIAGKMIFVYGFVAVATGKRWGWMPLDALKLKS